MADDILERLADVIRVALRQPGLAISAATTADDVDGWDSLAHSIVLMRIERAFAITLDPTDVLHLDDIGGLAGLIRDRLGVR
jgi:acyl carrier protein